MGPPNDGHNVGLVTFKSVQYPQERVPAAATLNTIIHAKSTLIITSRRRALGPKKCICYFEMVGGWAWQEEKKVELFGIMESKLKFDDVLNLEMDMLEDEKHFEGL